MPIRYKLHSHGPDTVLAAADISALGIKHLEQPAPQGRPRRVLDLITFRSFYDGETANEAQLTPLLSACSSANLVGPLTVGLAVRLGLAQKENVIEIGGVPHVQIYRIPDNGV